MLWTAQVVKQRPLCLKSLHRQGVAVLVVSAAFSALHFIENNDKEIVAKRTESLLLKTHISKFGLKEVTMIHLSPPL